MTDLRIPHPQQATIDRVSGELLSMSTDQANLVLAIAWQIAKDSGMSDWRQALSQALDIAREAEVG